MAISEIIATHFGDNSHAFAKRLNINNVKFGIKCIKGFVFQVNVIFSQYGKSGFAINLGKESDDYTEASERRRPID